MAPLISGASYYSERFLFFLISIKYLFDLLSEWRGLNFMVFSTTLLFGLGPVFRQYSHRRGFFLFFILVSLYFISMSLINDDYEMGIRFIVASAFFIVVYSNVINLSVDRIHALIIGLIYFLSGCVLLSFIISFAVRNPLGREFYGFEHANLLGSYVILGFSLLLFYVKPPSRWTATLVSVLSFVTTSTGAFLLSSVFWIRSYRFSFSNFIIFLVSFTLVVAFTYWLSFNYFPVFNDKVFYPFELLMSGGVGLVRTLALSSIEIQYLGQERESSLLWRIYAYFIFLDFYSAGNVINILFGRGFSGYLDAWGGIAPHNDFLLILIDFGLFGLFLLLFLLFRFFRSVTNIGGIALGVFVVVCFRMAFENNIYSFYILTNIVILFAFSFALGRNNENKNTRCF